MDYFWIKEDKSYMHTPVITNLNDIVNRRAAMSLENALNIADINVGFARSQYPLDYIDVLDSQLFLVNGEVKKVFSIYERSLQFKTVCILNNLDGSSCNYYAPLFTKVNCLPDEYKAVRNRNKLINLIIRASDVEDHSVFKIASIDTDIIIIRLDVAESLLRRKIKKLTLERVLLVN